MHCGGAALAFLQQMNVVAHNTNRKRQSQARLYLYHSFLVSTLHALVHFLPYIATTGFLPSIICRDEKILQHVINNNGAII